MNVYLVDMHNRDMRRRLFGECTSAQEALAAAKDYLATKKVETARVDVWQRVGHDSLLLELSEVVETGDE